MTTTQGIKLDDKIRHRLKVLGEKRNRSPHFLMRTAIEIYLEREEYFEREKSVDMERYEQYQLTGKVIEQEVVERWLEDLANNKATPCPQ